MTLHLFEVPPSHMPSFNNFPQSHSPVCPLPCDRASIYSPRSRLKLTKAGRGRVDSSNSEHFYDPVYHTAAETLVTVARGGNEQHQKLPFGGGAKHEHRSLNSCDNLKTLRYESFPQKRAATVQSFLHSICSPIFCNTAKYKILFCFNNKRVTQRQEGLSEHDQLSILRLTRPV